MKRKKPKNSIKVKMLLVILMFGKCVLGQEDLSYSISQFQRSDSDSEKAKLASDLAWELRDIAPDSSLYYAQVALTLSKKTSQKKIEAFSLSDIGNYYKRKEKYDIALSFYLRSLDIRMQLDNSRDIASGFNQIGLLYKQQEKYDSASSYFSQGISIVSNKKYPDLALKLYDGYAMTLYHIGKQEKALAYLDTSFALAENIGDSLCLAKSIQNKGVINQYLGLNLLALKFYKEAEALYEKQGNINGMIEVEINQAAVLITLGKRKKAEKILLKAEKQSVESGFEDNLLSIYMDLAELNKEDQKKSKTYFQKAQKNAIESDKTLARIESGIALGIISINEGNTTEAFDIINSLDSIIQGDESQKVRFNYYRLKSDYLNAVDKHKESLIFANKALNLKDSLVNDLNFLQDMSALLEEERNAKKLFAEKLRVNQAEKETIQEKSKTKLITIWFLLAIVFFLITLLYGKRKRLKIEHKKKIQEERFKAELQQKTYDADLKFLERNLSLEADIRKKIGQDLHDHLGSKLAVVQITLESIFQKEGLLTEHSNKLKEAINLVDKSCVNVRGIAHDLIESNISKESLHRSFQSHCETISNSGSLSIEYSLIGEPYPLSLDIKKHLHATITLLVDNIIKHSNAKNASLQLFYHEDCLSIELSDNGIGFEIEKKEDNNEGVGFKNARERIAKINGTIEIDSRKEHGTFISILIPLSDE